MIGGLLKMITKAPSQLRRLPWFWAPLLWPWCKSSHLWPWGRTQQFKFQMNAQDRYFRVEETEAQTEFTDLPKVIWYLWWQSWWWWVSAGVCISRFLLNNHCPFFFNKRTLSFSRVCIASTIIICLFPMPLSISHVTKFSQMRYKWMCCVGLLGSLWRKGTGSCLLVSSILLSGMWCNVWSSCSHLDHKMILRLKIKP